ncbi:MAG: TIGR02302 family protein [Marinosulfonomonas sp.]|nr:TIGR02302 family protein [Marinosulfonomonas sp.]
MTKQNRPERDALNGLAWPLRLTRLGMVAERATRAFWPLWAVLMLALALVMLGVQDFISPRGAMAVAAVFVAAAVWALIYGLRRFRWPRADEAVDRLDHSLPGRPITALTDTQAVGADDAASKVVWRAHLARMAERVRGAKPAPADLRVASRDPYALRYVAVLALLVALLFGSLSKVATVGDIATGQGGAALAAGPSWEGWIEPPAYTGKPSLYLNDLPTGDLSVPKGARITVRLYGEVGALSLRETVSSDVVEIADPAAVSHEVMVTQDGILAIEGKGGAEWTIALLPDMPPEVRIDGALVREARGIMRQPFAASDDYAVVRGKAEFRLDMDAIKRRYGLAAEPEERAPVVLDLPLPITGDRSEFTEELVDDLSEHAWVGLPVTLTLTVEDAAGQTGQSEPVQMMLPGRRFFAPLARAVIEQRRDLLWARENGARVAQVLRAVTHRPEGFVRNNGAYLMLRVALTRLEAAVTFDMTPEAQDEIAAALWEIALAFEDGSLADAKERLHRAQERLAEAMKNGASKDEIAELMQELRDATKDYMRQLAEQQRQNGEQGQQNAQNSETFSFTQEELQALMDRIQELMEEGRMSEAADLMERMNELMENLQMAEGGEDGEQSPGEQSMEDLQETLRNQQGLSDQAFRDLQEQFNPDASRGESSQNRGEAGGQGEGRSHEGQGDKGQGEDGEESGEQGGGQQGAGKEGLADRQQALRDELERQKGALPGAGTPGGDAARAALDRAERAMEGAEQALREGDLAEALNDQADAMEALREGMRSLSDAIAKNEQQQQNPGQQGEAQGRDNANARDPLGRDNSGRGKVGTNENLLQGDDVYRRARELLDEIRRRSGDQNRPDVELDYLKRLLDRF